MLTPLKITKTLSRIQLFPLLNVSNLQHDTTLIEDKRDHDKMVLNES